MTAEDERAIIKVLVRYATGIDRRDWHLFRTCFTDTFEGDYPGFGLWRGPDEITAFMEQAHAPLGQTLHRMTNFVVQSHGDLATARSYVDALLMPGEEGGEIHRAHGFYDDDFIRTSDGWKIRRRLFTAVQVL